MEETVVLRKHNLDLLSPSVRKSSMGPIEDLVECGICLDRLNEPKMLTCQHTFCLSCLQDFFATEYVNYYCPTCKKDFFVSNFNELPNNLYIDSLLKVLDSNNGNQFGTDKIVFPEVAKRCVQCHLFLEQSGQGNACQHCKQSFCTICFAKHMDDLQEQVVALAGQLDVARQRLQHKSDNFQNRWMKLNGTIQKFIELKICELKTREKELIKSVENHFNEDVVQEAEINEKISKLHSLISQKNNTVDPNTAQSFVDFHKQVSRIVDQISKWGETRITFNESNFSVEKYSPNESITPIKEEPMTPVSNSKDTLEYNMAKTKQFKSKFKWSKCPRPMGVAIAPWINEKVNDHLIYIAGSDCKIVFGIEKKKGRIVSKITHHEMIYPHSIAFREETGEIFVSDKWMHCIFVFHRHGEYLRTLGGKGDEMGNLRAPEGLAVQNNKLFICDTGNDRVQCLDSDTGEMLLQFGSIRREQIKMNPLKSRLANLTTPTSISVGDKDILVLDSSDCRIKIFDHSGVQLNEFGKMGSEKSQFKYPEVFVVDEKTGYIFVGDSGNARIQIFNREGHFIRVVGGSRGSHAYFNWISGICLTPDLELVVSDYKTHSVQILD